MLEIEITISIHLKLVGFGDRCLGLGSPPMNILFYIFIMIHVLLVESLVLDKGTPLDSYLFSS